MIGETADVGLSQEAGGPSATARLGAVDVRLFWLIHHHQGRLSSLELDPGLVISYFFPTSLLSLAVILHL